MLGDFLHVCAAVSENINAVCASVNWCVCMRVSFAVIICHYLKKMDVTECVALWLEYTDLTVCLSSETHFFLLLLQNDPV